MAPARRHTIIRCPEPHQHTFAAEIAVILCVDVYILGTRPGPEANPYYLF